jgi:hypothetical protein
VTSSGPAAALAYVAIVVAEPSTVKISREFPKIGVAVLSAVTLELPVLTYRRALPVLTRRSWNPAPLGREALWLVVLAGTVIVAEPGANGEALADIMRSF